mgnify:CR=1 FL=1
MGYFDQKEPPRREHRLQACIADGGTFSEVANRRMRCCLPDGERTFAQGNICLLLPALGIMNTIPDSVVLMHSAIGCGSSAHAGNAGVRAGNNARWGVLKDGTWLSTALTESDVICGGEEKLSAAIIEADKRFQPAVIFVVAGCVPGIIGDDIDGVAEGVQSQVAARILPVHCEGFKTKIWATSYDAVYHAIGRTLLKDAAPRAAKSSNARPVVNLFNVSSMGRPDEVELKRLLELLGLEVNIFPVFAEPAKMAQITQADLSVSTCPTHDDYLLRYLQETCGVPYILKHMPIGIANTGLWLRDVAAFFGLQEKAAAIIAREETELAAALAELTPAFAGKKVFLSAGEFRALATALLMGELGFEISGIRAFHHDEFAAPEYQKLDQAKSKDFPLNIANCQVFEEANLLKRTQPDVFLGHMNGNGTAAKLGITTSVIYNVGLQYVGYKGAYELARRLYRQLRNPGFNRNISKWAVLPYKQQWYGQDPFSHIKAAGGEVDG